MEKFTLAEKMEKDNVLETT
uniref:Uncharacterized protein n=1 Tax=Rhizophora mucronata TaxID=61149 RepID=A0A2P2QJV0_RHIMU